MADENDLQETQADTETTVPEPDTAVAEPQRLSPLPAAGVHEMTAAPVNPFDKFDAPRVRGPQAPKTGNPFDAFDSPQDRAIKRGLDSLPEFSVLKQAYQGQQIDRDIQDAIGRDALASEARRSAATLDPDGQKFWIDNEIASANADREKWQGELTRLADEHGGLENVPPSLNLPGIMDALQSAQSRHTLAEAMQEDQRLGIQRTHSLPMQAATAQAIEDQTKRVYYQQDVLSQVIATPGADPVAIENAKSNVAFERAKLEKLRNYQEGGQQRPAVKGATGTGELVRQFTVGSMATVPEMLGGAAIRYGQDIGGGTGEAMEALGNMVRDFGRGARRDTPAEASPNLLDLDWQKQGFFNDLKLYMAAKLGQGLGTSAPIIGAAIAGGGVPAMGLGVAMGQGQMQNALEEAFAAQGVDIPPDKVATYVYLYGAGIGALESVTELWALGGLSKEIAAKSLASSLARGVAKGAAIEGVTEGLQELLEIHGVSAATGQPIDWQEARRRIIESTVAGAIPGAALGGVTAKKGGGKAPEPPQRIEPTLDTPATPAAPLATEPTQQAPVEAAPAKPAEAAKPAEGQKTADTTAETAPANGITDVGDTFDLPPGATLSDDDINSVVDMWQYVQEVRRQPPPVSLSEWLKAHGGLREDAGELKNMLGAYNKRPGLVSSQGMGLDDATLKAWEAGFLEGDTRPEINDLLAALDDDLRGYKKVAAADRERMDDIATAEQMQRDLEDLGIKNVRTENDIRRILTRHKGGSFSDAGPNDTGESASGTRSSQEATGSQGQQAQGLTSYLSEGGTLSKADMPALAERLGVTPEELPKVLDQAVEDGTLRKTSGGMYRRAVEAQTQFRMASPEAARAAIDQAIAEIGHVLPKDVQVKPFASPAELTGGVKRDVENAAAAGYAVDAAYDPRSGDVFLSAYAMNPTGRIGHEGVHALKARNLISDAELSVLADRAAKIPDLFDRAAYEKAYASRPNPQALIAEEAAAHLIEARINGQDFGRQINTILDRIIQFFERLRNALAGKGFQTADDVVRAFMSGEMAGRYETSLRPDARIGMQAADTTMYSVFPTGLLRNVKITAPARVMTPEWTIPAQGQVAVVPVRANVERPRFVVRPDGTPVLEYPQNTIGVYDPGPRLFRYIDEFFSPIGPNRYIRMALRESDFEHVRNGTHKGSLNHATGESEGGLSVAFKPEAADYPYGYIVEGELLGQGTDSEPLLDLATVKVISKSVMTSDEVNELFEDRLEARLNDLGLTRDEYRFLITGAWLDRGGGTTGTGSPPTSSGGGASGEMAQRGEVAPGMASEAMFALRDAQTGQDMRRELDSLGYYSKALEAAKDLKQAKGTPEQMLAQLRSAGARESELDATGLLRLVEGKKSISKDEIVKHLTENRVGLTEATYGGAPKDINDLIAKRDAMLSAEQYDPLELRRVRDEIFNAEQSVARTKWSSYSLDPQNPTYRETVLHLPESRPSFEQFLKARQDAGYAYPDPSTEMLARYRSEYDAGGWRSMARGQQEAWRGAADTTFRSGHFSEPNIIGHMMTSMVAHEGKPTFLIDQIQSDWGQKLRDGGVRDEAKIADLKRRFEEAYAAEEEVFSRFQASLPDGDRAKQSREDARDRLASLAAKEAAIGVRWQKAWMERQMLGAELRTAEASTPGHPLVNTTDQWTTTTLRRAVRQAAEADAEFIAIPSGDTVLSYNPGDEHGMAEFYGKIVPKNLRNILQKIDKESPPPQRIDTLDSPSGKNGLGKGFTLFPLTDKVKQSVREEGQAMFALRDRLDMSPEARKARAEAMGFDTSTVWYHGTREVFKAFSKKMIGANFAADERGFFFINDPRQASEYATGDTVGLPATGGSVIPAFLRMQRPLIVDDARLKREGMEPIGKTEDVISFWDNYQSLILEWADAEKADSVVLVDNSTRLKAQNAGQPIMLGVVFDPRNVRSVNAAFDPERSGRSDLMYSLRDRLGLSRTDPQLQSMNALVRDLAADLGIVVRRGFKTTASKTAKAAGTRAGVEINAYYDPTSGVLRLRKYNDVASFSEAAGNILSQRFGKIFQKTVDRVNQGIQNDLNDLAFEKHNIPLRENNLDAMRAELDAIRKQGFVKDSVETRVRGDVLARDIPRREADLAASKQKIAALEAKTRDAAVMPSDMGAWFSTYLMNPASAAVDPFTDVFEAALDAADPTMLAKIEGAQQAISAYAKANPSEVMRSIVVPSTKDNAWDRLHKDAQRFGWRMALGLRLSDFYANVWANDHPLFLATRELLVLNAANTGKKLDLKAVENPAKLWRLAAQARAKATRDLDKGIRLADQMDNAGPSMSDVLTTALGPNRREAVDTGPGSRYRDFGAYLMSRMGVERWSNYENAVSAGNANGLREPYAVPKSVMVAAIHDLEAKYPTFMAAAEQLYQFQNNLLTLQWQKDLITDEQYQALSQEKNYVPSLRSFEDEQQLSGGTGKKGEAAKADIIKRFRGSQRDVIDPIASIALKVFKARVDIARNDSLKQLLHLAESVGPGGGLIAERLDPRQAQAFEVDLKSALRNAAKEANLSENDRAALVDLASEMLGSNVTTTVFSQGKLTGGKGEPIVWIKEKGKAVPVRLGKMGEGGVASARLGQQIWDMLNTFGETHTNWVINMMALPAQMVRSAVVSHPSFMLANIIRDAPAAWGYDPKAIPLWTQLKGAFDVARGAEYVERYRTHAGMMGGEATQLFDDFLADHDVETLVRKGYRFKVFDSVGNAVSFLTDAFSTRNWPDKAFGAAVGGIAGFGVAGPAGMAVGAGIGATIGGKTIAAVGELSETATRAQLWKHAYERAVKSGLSDVEAAAEAAFWAHDYGDYSRHGLKTDVFRRWVPFLNANLQANDSFARRLLAKGDYGFESTKHLPGYLALWPLYKAGVLQLPATLTNRQREEIAMSAWTWFQTMAVIGSASLVYALLYRDDDRIKMLPDSLRANHWNIPLDDLARAIGMELPKEHRGKHFARIPKPFERAIVANTIERLAMEYAKGNPRWLEHWLQDAYEVTKPPLMPTMFDIPAQILMNRDSFSGREIVPRMGSGQRTRPEMYDEYTSQFARWLGQKLDLAPQQVDFFIAKLGSTWGRDATRANIPGAPWYDPKAPAQGLDEKFIASRFLYKIGKGTEAEKAMREAMGGETTNPLASVWDRIAQPYNHLDANAESYKFLKDRMHQDAAAFAKLDGMTPQERGYALLEGHWQGQNSKYQQLHPMKRAETVSQLVSQMQKELLGDHATAGKKGPRQTMIDLSPTEKAAARDVLTQFKAMEVFNALVLTGEKGWQNRGYLPAQSVLDELKTAVPEIHAEFTRRLEKAHVLPFEGVKTTWPRVKSVLEGPELLRRVKDKDTVGIGALLATEYSEAKFTR